MKTRLILPLIVILVLAVAASPASLVRAQEPTATSTPTAIRTITPTPTLTNTPEPPVYARPMVVISSYGAGQNPIEPGHEFDLQINLNNSGGAAATNLIIVFTSTDFYPKETGGVHAVSLLGAGSSRTITQRMLATEDLWGRSLGTVTVSVTYNSVDGSGSFSETFQLTIDLKQPNWGPLAPTATPTAMQINRPQIVVENYTTDIDPLQPGSIFNLALNLRNLGNADARSVTMVLGGGVTIDSSGTPQPGGVSGGGSDLTTFAPLGSSNLVYLGDIPAGSVAASTEKLIVNVSANPGAYTFKISFVYTDPKGFRLLDDQVITLLIYRLPQVEVNFYRDPGIFFSGTPSILPIQVTNLGRGSTVLGNLTISGDNADITNNVSLVGALDPGGYFTLDANIVPFLPGAQDLKVLITYTDDFNQPRTIEQILTINVEEIPTEVVNPDFPNGGEVIPEPEPETFWDKVVRFIKGLLGLDSGKPVEEPIPSEMIPEEKEIIPIVPKG